MAKEDEIIEYHHQLNGHEFEQTQGDSEGQGSLGMLQFMGLQKVGHKLVTEYANLSRMINYCSVFCKIFCTLSHLYFYFCFHK